MTKRNSSLLNNTLETNTYSFEKKKNEDIAIYQLVENDTNISSALPKFLQLVVPPIPISEGLETSTNSQNKDKKHATLYLAKEPFLDQKPSHVIKESYLPEDIYIPPNELPHEKISSRRGTWNTKGQYILSCIAFTVGLGNIWRFPWLCQKHGGGAFIFPYVIMLIVMAIPMVLIELGMGQRMGKGPLQMWSSINPVLAGIGIGTFLVACIQCAYYNTVVSWCLLYLSKSFSYPLPWSVCLHNSTECVAAGAPAYFWYRESLNISESVDTGIGFSFKICVMILLSWGILFFCTVKGIKCTGQISYFTALCPYAILFVFLLRGLTLPGFELGLNHMFRPRFEKLLDPVVWLEAATQCLFTMSLGMGGLVAMSSHMPKSNNCITDVFTITITNLLTSIYASITLFSIIGFRASREMEKCLQTSNNTKSDCNLDKFLTNSIEGPGLAFLAITEAINQFGSLSPLFAILFFLMLVTLGMGTMIGALQGILTSLLDLEALSCYSKTRITAVTCGLFVTVAQVFALTNGEYLVQICDEYAMAISLMIVCTCELFAVIYVYGVNRFCDDIEAMCGFRPNCVLVLCCRIFAPLSMSCVLVASIFSLMVNRGASYLTWDAVNGQAFSKQIPMWAQISCGIIILICTLPIPIIAILIKFEIICGKQFHNQIEDEVNSDFEAEISIRCKTLYIRHASQFSI